MWHVVQGWHEVHVEPENGHLIALGLHAHDTVNKWWSIAQLSPPGPSRPSPQLLRAFYTGV